MKKMTSSIRRSTSTLSINPETIRPLSQPALAAAAGGACFPPITVYSPPPVIGLQTINLQITVIGPGY